MSFNSAAEILDAFRELQQAADAFETSASDWESSSDVVDSRAIKLQQAFQKFAFMMRTSP